MKPSNNSVAAPVLKAPRSPLSGRSIETLGQGEEPEAPGDGAGDGAHGAARDDDRLQATGKGPLAYPLLSI